MNKSPWQRGQAGALRRAEHCLAGNLEANFKDLTIRHRGRERKELLVKHTWLALHAPVSKP